MRPVKYKIIVKASQYEPNYKNKEGRGTGYRTLASCSITIPAWRMTYQELVASIFRLFKARIPPSLAARSREVEAVITKTDPSLEVQRKVRKLLDKKEVRKRRSPREEVDQGDRRKRSKRQGTSRG